MAEYARDFIETYGEGSIYGGRTGKDSGKLTTSATQYPGWTNGTLTSPGGTLYCCCTSGVWYMYYLALGIDIYQYGFSASSGANLTLATNYSDYWEEVSFSESLPGDIIVRDGHVELITGAGNTEHANFGGSDPAAKITTYNLDDYTKAFRLKSSVEVTPNGTLLSSSSSSTSSIEFSNFYFNGIPDGKYSVAHTSIFSLIIDNILELGDYLIGLITYIVRIPIIGWTAIIDNLLTWTVNTVTDIDSDEEEDMGIDSVEVESADDDERITIDGLLYNSYDLTNINIFQ